MSSAATFHGRVSTWELDANDHWNTKFYLRGFREAADRAAFDTSTQLVGAAPRIFHVRFFREFRALESLAIETYRLPEESSPYRSVHVMRSAADGAICAGALDMVDFGDGLPSASAEHVEKIKPRSVPVGPFEIMGTHDRIAQGKAAITYAGIARPDDFDHQGQILPVSVHATVTEGTGHLWRHVGLNRHDFFEASLGRAIVELKMEIHEDSLQGDPLQLVSWFGLPTQRSFQAHHQLENLRTGKPVASIHTASVTFDMKARRALTIPDRIFDAISTMSQDTAHS